MSRKKINSTELKLAIMKCYQKGESLRILAQKYHVNENNIQKRKAAYAEHRIEGLTTRNIIHCGKQQHMSFL